MSAKILFLLIGVSTCFAQQWEIGVAGGSGMYRHASVYAPAGKATAGVQDRFVLSFLAVEELNQYISGEIRYTYQDGDPFLSAGSVKTNLQGQSHAFHYDVLFHFRSKQHRLRPYMAAGIGAKLYRISGPPNPVQPLSNIATLTTEDDVKTLFTAGGGVKIRVAPNVLVRFEFLDYITPFPTKLIKPAPFATDRGIFQQFTPMAGISYVF